jgi:peptidoglycan/xylan/chitin deacetylase (PgdA/CDA1 family)
MSRENRVSLRIESAEHEAEIAYAAAHLFSVLGLRHSLQRSDAASRGTDETVVTYGRSKPRGITEGGIHLVASPVWSAGWRRAEEWIEGGFLLEDSGEIDPLATAFYHLARIEEYGSRHLDAHGRFPLSASCLGEGDAVQSPIVDQCARMLLERLGPAARRGSGPWDGHPYACCLTHDIDRVRLFRGPRGIAGALHASIRSGPRTAIRVLRDGVRTLAFRGEDPYRAGLRGLKEMEADLGVCATYFFLAGGGSRFDGRYALDELSRPIRDLEAAGHEIGLHGSYGSYRSAGILAEERRRLSAACREPIGSCRQHYLRFRTPDTWQAAEAAGLRIDTTMGYAERAGFRAGTAFPFHPYRLLERRPADLWEIPLHIMDTTLFGYQGLSPDAALDEIGRVRRAVRDVGGALVLLWHNSTLYDPLRQGGESVLRRVLADLQEDDAMFATIGGIAQRWSAYTRELRCGSS